MDYKFLDKVLNQLVRETILDYRGRGKIFTPFASFPYFVYSSSSFYRSNFTKHCRDVYSLNGQEIEYVWKVYRDDITYKIERGG